MSIGKGRKKERFLMFIQFIRLIPMDIIYLTTDNKDIIRTDIEKNLFEIPYDDVGLGALNYSLLYIKPYRSVFYYRTKGHCSPFLHHFSRWILKPIDTIEIVGNIGKGFRIFHNYMVINLEKAGDNFTVNQGVTIGKGRPRKSDPDAILPIFGNNVRVYSNAMVFGGIIIGNNVNIGAGAVVNKDVPDNCSVIGNPMRIILKKSTDEPFSI